MFLLVIGRLETRFEGYIFKLNGNPGGLPNRAFVCIQFPVDSYPDQAVRPGQYLDSYLEGIKTFHGGAPAPDNTYFNLKSQCAFKLAEVINAGLLYIDCPEELQSTIAEELEACLVARDVDADTSKKRIIDKREMKAVLGRSPDYFDPLMMRMYYEIVPQPKGMRVHVGRLS